MKCLTFGQKSDLGARSPLSLILILSILLAAPPAHGTEPPKNPYASLETFAALGLVSDGESCRFRARQLVRRYLNQTSTLAEQAGDWTCLAVRDTVKRDSMNRCRPAPSDALSTGATPTRLIYGTISYVGVYEKPYFYDLMVGEGDVNHISLRIAFKNASEEDTAAMAIKIDRAQGNWNRHVPADLDGKLRFHFSVVQPGAKAHFELNLQATDTRGPYDKNWSLDWSENDVTHEIGHMLGLDDEYRQLRTTFNIAHRRYRSEIATAEQQLTDAELAIDALMNNRNQIVATRAQTSRFDATRPGVAEADIQANQALAVANEARSLENDAAIAAANAHVNELIAEKRTARERRNLHRNFCNPTSVMCGGGRTEKPLPYHYYLILRRAHCQ